MTNKNALLILYAALVIPLLFGCGGRSTFSEEARATSPNGMLDAVMILEGYGGAVGGFEWHAFIVTKGGQANPNQSQEIFRASTLRGEKLVWTQPHLLEIRYDVAHIEHFRNLWGLNEVQNVGSRGEHDYSVEVRLVPSSPDFSLLTPYGGFKPK